MNLRNTYHKPIRNFYIMMTFSLIVFLNVWVGCHNPPEPVAKEVTSENALLDSTFRIDIKTITVTYDIYPGDFQVEGTAVLTFQMRNGQTKPIVHFDPAIYDKSIINSISLNGEALDVSNTSDVSVKGFTETHQSGLEFQRELGGGIHTLEMSYTLALPDEEEWIYSDVNDVIGNGNEEWFPTLNTPHELARHRLTFRVHSEKEYHFIGSGLVVQTDNGAGTTAGLTGLTAGLAGGNVQEWTLDTEREIASYTVMFMAMPADLVDYEEAT
ncbi:MAG: M1 family metallopeptidase, partial [bacterium]|nr:M1 family metallopeptidase [bacterium]